MSKNLASLNIQCPATGFKRPCIASECPKYIKLEGTNPQTGERQDEWACSDTWLPLLIVENTRRLNEVGAAIESYRNELHGVGKAILQGAANYSESVNGAIARILEIVANTDKIVSQAMFNTSLTGRVREILRTELPFGQTTSSVQVTEGEPVDEHTE